MIWDQKSSLQGGEVSFGRIFFLSNLSEERFSRKINFRP